MEKGGLRFNEGKLKWSLVSWAALVPMIRVLMYGAHKYSTFEKSDGTIVTGAEVTVKEAKKLKQVSSGSNNWKNGLSYNEVSESLMRHLYAFSQGEDNDPESKLTHIGHILCNALFLSYMFLFRKDLDDRDIDKNIFKSKE